MADWLVERTKSLQNKPFSLKNESATRGGLRGGVADWIATPPAILAFVVQS